MRPSPIFGAVVAAMIVGGVITARSTTIGRAELGVFVLVAAGWVVSLCLHEFSHALVAFLGGDRSVVEKGYLTLDFRKYTDIGLSLLMPLVFLLIGGIGLPGGAVWINQGAIRNPRTRSLVSLAGPAANLLMGALCLSPFWLGLLSRDSDLPLAAGLAFLAHLQFIAALLNMLPVPGLDGFGAIEPYLPQKFLAQIAPFRPYSFLILFVLFFRVDALHTALYNGSSRIMEFLSVPDADILRSVGYQLFQFWR